MADFVETVGIEAIVRKAGHQPTDNFEKIYSQIDHAGLSSVIHELDAAIRAYFAKLKLPNEPTVYDRLVLSLRPKDLIVTFNWDPLLGQAYKRWRRIGGAVPRIAFLHGNVDIGVDLEKGVSGFLSDEPISGRKLSHTRLLYPVEQKNYTDPFIAEQWRQAAEGVEEAYYVTIFGYSAPTTDRKARELLLNAWRDNPTRGLAQISVIDIRKVAEVEASWSDFIVRGHGWATDSLAYSILMRHPRRSCEAFAAATLMQVPWREDPMPMTGSLAELEQWLKPLIEEEASGRLAGEPHH